MNYRQKNTVRVAMAALAVFAFIITACSGVGKGFRIEGRLLSMNRADFLVYSPDGAISGVDTLHVEGGRFSFSKPVTQEGTVVIVFPNFVRLPIFVKPGADISIDGNAAHLKELKVEGTDDNERFSEWRKNTSEASPAELKRLAAQFIQDNPASPLSLWLLREHFILCAKPDVKQARRLMKTIMKASGSSALAARMNTAVNSMGDLNVGDRLPRFSATDINGNTVTEQQLMKGRAVVVAWTSWSYESQNQLRQLASNLTFAADSMRIGSVVTICLDPSVQQCRQTLRSCNAEKLTTICDGQMIESPLLRTLDLRNIPDNLKLQDGKVIGRSMPTNRLLKSEK